MASGHEPKKRRIRKPRGKGLRTRSGCTNCRKRHVKCPEDGAPCSACARVKQSCSFVVDRREEIGARSVEHSDLGQSGYTRERIATAERSFESQGSARSDDSFLTQDVSTTNERRQSPDLQLPSLKSPPLDTPRPYRNTVRFEPSVLDSRYALEPIHTALTPTEAWAVGSVSSAGNVEADTAGWFGMLFEDAVLGNSSLPLINFEDNGLDIFGNSIPQTPVLSLGAPPTDHVPSTASTDLRAETSNTSLLERVPRLGKDQLYEKQSWHSSEPISLLPKEQYLLQHFVRNISQWLDFFDPKAPFGTFVPHLAIHNVGLMNSILALSVRHLSLNAASNGPTDSDFFGDALQYYYKTLHYIQRAMEFDTYRTSLELLSTALIVSAYEMLDGSSKDWERHLKGVFWIQRSQVIHGDSKGLRSAVWWAWLCQDVWASFREKRKPFTFWRPVRTFDNLDPHELASRSVHLFAQVVGYCSHEAIENDGNQLDGRIAKARELFNKLEDWHKYLTIEFEPMPLQMQLCGTQHPLQNAFEPVWIHPPSFAVSLQLYYCSQILLLLHQPHVGDFDSYLKRRNKIGRCINMICGIAIGLDDSASGVMCAQCVFIAGLALEDPKKREAVLAMLTHLRQRVGWPMQPLEDDLLTAWKTSDSA